MWSALLLFSSFPCFSCAWPSCHSFVSSASPTYPLIPRRTCVFFIGVYDSTKAFWFCMVATGHLEMFPFFLFCKEVLNSVGHSFLSSLPQGLCNVLKWPKQPTFKDKCLSFQITKKLVKGSAEKNKMRLQRVRHFPWSRKLTCCAFCIKYKLNPLHFPHPSFYLSWLILTLIVTLT